MTKPTRPDVAPVLAGGGGGGCSQPRVGTSDLLRGLCPSRPRPLRLQRRWVWELVCWAEEGVGIPCPVPLIRVEVSRLRYPGSSIPARPSRRWWASPRGRLPRAVGVGCVCLCVCVCACARGLSGLKALCPEPGAKRCRVFGAPWGPLPSWGLPSFSLPASDPDPDVRAGSAAEGRKGSLVPISFMPPSVKGESPVFWSLVVVGGTSVAQARGRGCRQGKSQRSQEPLSAPRWAGWTSLSLWGSGGRIVTMPGNWPWSPADLPDAGAWPCFTCGGQEVWPGHLDT